MNSMWGYVMSHMKVFAASKRACLFLAPPQGLSLPLLFLCRFPLSGGRTVGRTVGRALP